MRLSREARILFAFVAVAAAAWIWINFFSRSNPTLTAEEAATEALTPEVADDAALEADANEEGVAAADAGAVTEGDTVNDSSDTDTSDTTTNAEDDEAAPETVEASTAGDDNTGVDDTVIAVGGGTDQDDAAGDAGEGAAESSTEDVVASELTDELADAAESTDEAIDPEVDDDMPLVADEPSDDEPSDADGTPSVAQTQPVAARDVEIAELPFLITEPPAAEDETLTEDESGLELARPRSGLRVTVNPFSPLVLAPQEVTAVAVTPPAPTTPGIVNVPIPDGPTTRLGTTGTFPSAGPDSVSAGINPGNGPSSNSRPDLSDISAPVPRPLTPQPLQASNLPRPLPGGTLSSTPDILRTTRSAPVVPANPLGSTSLSDVAALRIPGQSGSAVSFNDAPAPALGDSASATEPAPLPVGSRRATGGPPATNDPLAAGVSELSRYLRDNNFQFTGSVIGPVGVGVFRSSLAAAPVTVVLGQALQDTNIVLTSLKGKQAEFTQNDEKQVLTLDLR